MTKDDLEKMHKYVIENQSKLKTCSGHTFEPIDTDRVLSSRQRCSSCGGEVDAMSAVWYARGIAHGKAASA